MSHPKEHEKVEHKPHPKSVEPVVDPRYKEMCDEFEANRVEAKVGLAGSVGAGFFNGLFARILSGWTKAGLAVGDFWSWLPVVLQLISTLGPEIQKIIDIIKGLIDGGKKPADFVTTPAVEVG